MTSRRVWTFRRIMEGAWGYVFLKQVPTSCATSANSDDVEVRIVRTSLPWDRAHMKMNISFVYCGKVTA